jgi:Toprim domain
MIACRPVDIGVVAGMLADRIDSLVHLTLPNARREGAEWRVGSLAGEPGRSMAIHSGGGRSGVWADFSTGERGDALDLVAAVLFRGDKAAALTWSRRWLGIESGDPAAIEQHRQRAAERREQARQDDDRRRSWATRLFLAAQTSLADTPASTYLASRAIDLAQLGRQPRALRFHPSLWSEESGRHWPAIVAAISNGDGRMVGCHRTWLKPDGGGKAPLRDPKLSLGAYRGGCIRLWRGAGGKPLKDAAPGEAIVVSEGIEDGLSVAIAAPEFRVVCAVSLSNLGNLELPPAITEVIVIAQNDPVGSQAAKALDRAVQMLLRQGRRVRIARPPAEVKDANDLLRQTRGAA